MVILVLPLILGQNFLFVSWNIFGFSARAYQLLFPTEIDTDFGSGAPNEFAPSYKNLGNDSGSQWLGPDFRTRITYKQLVPGCCDSSQYGHSV